MNAFDRLAASPPTISTKAELLQRMSERPAPTPDLTCEPQGTDASELKQLQIQSNEDRIARLRASLDRSSANLQHDQAKSRLDGFARAQFEHEK